MLSKQTFVLLSLCALGGVLASTSENHMVLVDNPDVPNVEQPARTTIDAVPSGLLNTHRFVTRTHANDAQSHAEVDFRTDIPDFVPTHEWREVMDGQSVPAVGFLSRHCASIGRPFALPGLIYRTNVLRCMARDWIFASILRRGKNMPSCSMVKQRPQKPMLRAWTDFQPNVLQEIYVRYCFVYY